MQLRMSTAERQRRQTDVIKSERAIYVIICVIECGFVEG